MNKKFKKTILCFTIILLILTIPSFVSANENITDNILSISNENNIINLENNDTLVGDNYYGDGQIPDDVDGRVYGVYYGPYHEPAMRINQFEINSTDKIENNQVTINVTFDGVIYSNIFTLDRYPLTIKENNNQIGAIPPSAVSNIDYPTDQQTPYRFTALFNYTLKDFTTHLKLRLCGFESNTLVFKYIDAIPETELNENSIIINNKNKIIKSNSTWLNTIDSLEKAINLAEDNAIIQLNNIELFTNKILTINKNITITGKNATINGFKSTNSINVNSNVKFINITFTNTTTYLLNINENTLIENCIFKDTSGIINNTADLKIVNSTFKNINAIQNLPEINDKNALINNQKNMEIINSTFTNITLPYALKLNNKNINESYIIYNSNNTNTKIYNTKFDKNNARILNNNGKTILDKSNITNTGLLPNINNITTLNKKINNKHALYSSYCEIYTPDTITGPIINSNELNMSDCYIENITWKGQKGLYSDIIDGQYYIWYLIYEPYYKISAHHVDRSNSFLTKAGAVYNTGKLNINSTTFKNLKATSSGAIENEGTLTINNTIFTNTQANKNGGAITNKKILTVENTLFDHTAAGLKDYGDGGAIYTSGNTTINKSNFTYCEGSYGQAIVNHGNININNSIFDKAKDSSTLNFNGGVLYNGDEGNFTLTNSTIKNTRFKIASTWPAMFYGVVINEGNMNVTRNIFDNNTPKSYENIIGTYNLFNMGKMNATFNIFTNTMRSHYTQTTNVYAINTNDGEFYMNYNYFDYNKDPYGNHTNFEVNQFFQLGFEPDYVPLEIGENTTLTVYLKLNNGKYYTDYTQLPEMNITLDINGTTMTKKLIDGKTSININNTQNKGTYYVTASYGEWSQTVQIDIGKENSTLDVKAEEIYYGENATFYMTVTGNYTHQPTGNITIIVDGKEYTTKIKNTKAELTIPGMVPKTYDLIIRYEGDEDYFKAFFHENYTVHKYPTQMNISIEPIYYGQNAIILVNLTPKGFSNQAYMYIVNSTDTIKKTVYVRDGTKLPLKNFAAGEYNVTIITWNHSKYESCNASAIFIVKKYESNLTINTSDITVGETAYLNVTLTPEGEVAGEANLTINNKTETIYLKNGNNTIKLENLTGGTYNITIFFPGDKKYTNATATTTLNVKKHNTTIKATINDNEITVKVNPSNATGTVNLYINDQLQKLNLTNGQATFTPKYNKFNNSIFIYYEGDEYYNYTTYNTNYEYNKLANLTAYNVLTYDGEKGTIYITLTDEAGYGIANKNITITINNKKYTRTTNQSGTTTLTLTLPIGNYTYTSAYAKTTVKNTFTVVKNINLTSVGDLEVYDKETFQYYVKLTDGRNNNIIGAEVTFKINGQTYTNKTNNNGIARIILNLNKGNYTITATYKTETVKNKITIRENDNYTITAKNLEMYYRDGSSFNITLKDGNSNTLSGRIITFTINKNTYTRTTNSNGIASLTINLPAGRYEIKTTYIDTSITNKITIKDYPPVITGNDIEMYYRDGTNYTVTLKDTKGTALANKEVIFTVDDENYTRLTNKDGIASITINLPEGIYEITATYKNVSTTNKITIKDYPPVITGSDIEMYYRDGTNYTITLKNTKGTPLVNVDVTFNINNRNYTRTTDSNGIARITINLPTGTYTIKTSYKNATKTNRITIKDYPLVITGSDIEMYYRDGTNYTITLKNTKGTTLANKIITFTITRKDYNRTTNNKGEASVTINLPAGTYEIKATYQNISTTNKIIVKEYPPVLITKDLVMYFHDNSTFKATLTNTNGDILTNRKVTFTIENETYTGTTNNQGTASLIINLAPGNYTIKTTYQNTTKTNNIEIKTNYNLETKDLVMIYKDGSRFTAKLTDKNGNTLKNATILFTINGQKYTRTSNSEGIASIAINLNSGKYTITTRYQEEVKTNNITIKATVEAKDIAKIYRNATQYYAKFTDNNGNALKNTQVTFNINGVYYERTTNESGVAKLNLNLQQGKYILTAINPITGENAANNITILPTITENRDITKYYKNATQYTVKLIKPDGSIAGAGEKVTFNINGVYYERTTNESGIAKMNINLNPGDYIITAEYAGCKVSNNIKVLPTIKAQDLTKKYGTPNPFTATLLDGEGKPLANEKVTFNINGVFYTRTTDADGIAKLNINLQAGKYIITSSYNGLNVANTVTVH